ncbi:MAG: hypothetical protein SGILL_002181 [Bacillariaceae sp.]
MEVLAGARSPEETDSKQSASVVSPSQPGAVAVAGMADASTSANAGEETQAATNSNGDELSPDMHQSEENTTANVAGPPLPSSSQGQSASSVQHRRPTFTLPVAEEYQETPAISAELVAPKADEISGILHVDIDPEESTIFHSQSREQHIEPLEIQHAKPEIDEAEKKRSKRKRQLFAFIGLIVVVIITSVITAVIVKRKESSREEGESAAVEQATMAPTFPYPCFNSTLDIFTAQYLYPDENLLIMCPGTRIKVGTLRDPARDDLNITGGDFPIILFRRNMTVQCGQDGKRSNSCVLDGGAIQVISRNVHYHPEYGLIEPDSDTDNFTIRGFTFTGKVEGSGVFGGIPTILSHPGKNIRFEDCAWVDLTATKRVIAVGANYMMTLMGIGLPDLVAELFVDNCLFDDVLYEEEFLVTFNQALHVQNTIFRNIRLPELLPPGCGVHPNGCRNLLHCHAGNPTSCSIENICVENAAVTGAGPIVISQDTDWTASGVNSWIGPLEYDPQYLLPSENAMAFCDLSVAILDDVDQSQGYPGYSCLQPQVFILDTGSCLPKSR